MPSNVSATAETPVLEMDRANKTYRNGVVALEEISLKVRRHEFVCVVGPSGCGKSTLLKLVSGIEPPTSGSVLYEGEPVRGLNTKVGFVTQDSNLFPWLTLQGNVEFALRMQRIGARERSERARDWIRIAGLSGFENAYPNQLSGGMQKRGSIARTLVYKPDFVLMDEPFGALDAQTRLFLQHELLEMRAREKLTVLFVTHDLQEAVALSDRVVLLSRSPSRVLKVVDVPLSRPRNVFKIHEQPGFKDVYNELWETLQSQFQHKAFQGRALA